MSCLVCLKLHLPISTFQTIPKHQSSCVFVLLRSPIKWVGIPKTCQVGHIEFVSTWMKLFGVPPSRKVSIRAPSNTWWTYRRLQEWNCFTNLSFLGHAKFAALRVLYFQWSRTCSNFNVRHSYFQFPTRRFVETEITQNQNLMETTETCAETTNTMKHGITANRIMSSFSSFVSGQDLSEHMIAFSEKVCPNRMSLQHEALFWICPSTIKLRLKLSGFIES